MSTLVIKQFKFERMICNCERSHVYKILYDATFWDSFVSTMIFAVVQCHVKKYKSK
jgi:hypothetical protein